MDVQLPIGPTPSYDTLLYFYELLSSQQYRYGRPSIEHQRQSPAPSLILYPSPITLQSHQLVSTTALATLLDETNIQTSPFRIIRESHKFYNFALVCSHSLLMSSSRLSKPDYNSVRDFTTSVRILQLSPKTSYRV
jgi:hypothetical protein